LPDETPDATLAEVRPGGQAGPLGIAVSQSYLTDRFIYVYYRRRGQPHRRVAPREAARPIFAGIPKSGNHDGGRIALGPDGMPYTGNGDAGVSPAGSRDRGRLSSKYR
jgi:glucose/arabinose dehydrogenase